MLSDKLSSLPINTAYQQTPQDEKVMRVLFGTDGTPPPPPPPAKSGISTAGLLIPSAFFLALNLPFVDRYLRSKISTESEFTILIVKTIIFVMSILVFQLLGVL